MTTAAGSKRIAPDADGTFTLDAAMLAEAFGWTADQMAEMIRRRMVTSLVERGEAEDAGRWRLSVRCGNRRWRAIVDRDGGVVDQQMDLVPPQMTGPAAAASPSTP